MQLSTLSVLLAAQLGLAGYLWYSNNQQSAPEPLLQQADLTTLTLTKGPGKATSNPDAASMDGGNQPPDDTAQTLTLQLQDGQWRFSAGSAEQPVWLAASTVKLQPILTDLQKARLHWPITDSKDSLQRFTLADNAYQWLDKTLLAVKDIQAVRGADFTLSKKTGNTTPAQWQLSGLLPAQLPVQSPRQSTADSLNQTAVDQLLTNLQTLTVQQYQPKPHAETTTWQAATQLTISSGEQGGITKDVNLQLVKAGDHYLVRRSDIAAVFSLDQTQYNNLVSITLASLQQSAKDAVAATATSAVADPARSGDAGSNTALKTLQQLKAGQTVVVAPATSPAAAQPQSADPD